MPSFRALILLLLLMCLKRATAGKLSNISKCYNFTENEILIVLILRSGLSFLSMILSIPIAALFFAQMCFSQKPVKHTDRLIFYISIATSLYALTQSLQWLHIYTNEVSCSLLGVTIQYMSLSVLILTACTGFHLSLLIQQTKCLKVVPDSTSTTYRKQEITYLLVTTLFPILLAPWPFLYDLYGNSGAWCWIKSADYQCRPILQGVIMSIMLYYAWAAVLLPCVMVVTSVVLVILCLRRAQRPHPSMYSLLVYMVIFSLTTFAGSVGGGLLWKDPSVYGYLLVQTLSEPAFTMLSAAVVLCHMCWSRYSTRSGHVYYDKLHNDFDRSV